MSAASGLARVRNVIIPECNNLGRTIKMSSWLVVISLLIALVMLIIAVIYTYVKKTSNSSNDGSSTSQYAVGDTDEDKKNKIIGGLSITGIVFVALSVFVAIWSATIAAKTTNTCLTSS